MLKGLGNIASLMKQAQEMQGRMGEIRERLGQMRVSGEAGGGMVTVEATGQQKIVACHIEPSLLESPDQELLEDLIVSATNQALEKAREATAAEVEKLTGGLNLPGLGNALAGLGQGE